MSGERFAFPNDELRHPHHESHDQKRGSDGRGGHDLGRERSRLLEPVGVALPTHPLSLGRTLQLQPVGLRLRDPLVIDVLR